jgi:hypothetical protein
VTGYQRFPKRARSELPKCLPVLIVVKQTRVGNGGWVRALSPAISMHAALCLLSRSVETHLPDKATSSACEECDAEGAGADQRTLTFEKLQQ